ncbi:MAG: phosphoglucosamine mutase [Rhodobacterales bacterium]
MNRKYFGTDGVRGKANTFPMTPDVALKLGAAAGRHFRRDGEEHRVIIGKDTRRSGYMFENALTAGLTSTGMNVFLLGPIPTPAVGFLTKSMRADLGVMISASHNHHNDNGIKFFGPDGFKLSDESEFEIEEIMENGFDFSNAENIGRARRVDDGLGRYVEHAKASYQFDGRSLKGLKIVIDCANGAAYKVAPQVLFELGADVIPIGVTPNGYNINVSCGSTSPELAAQTVIDQNADLGICLDGDADRLLIIDEKGNLAHGDHLLGVFARELKVNKKLSKDTLVSTTMSNLGLEIFLSSEGINLVRTGVGDRYVVEKMLSDGFNLGGEQSGHIIMSEFSTTGDGLVAALQFIAAMQRNQCNASKLLNLYDLYPQILKNIKINGKLDPFQDEQVMKLIKAKEDLFAGKGRLVIRKSGTEPLIRVMGEHEDENLLKETVYEIVDTIKGMN